MKRPLEAEAEMTLEEDVEAFRKGLTEADWIASLPGLIAAHGKDAVEGWKDATKHGHRLIHLAVAKNYGDLVWALVQENGFDMNIARDSDQCTPMHLAMLYKKPGVIRVLHTLGADLSQKNKYGESCNAKYEAFINSHQNIIWMDMEFTHGHYEGALGGAHAGEAPNILEAGVIVTDKELRELARGHWVVGGFTKEQLEDLPDFHQKHFRDKNAGGEFPPFEDRSGNGLFSDVLGSQATLETVETEIVRLLSQHCPEQACPLAGNSIQCDREALKVRMPKVYAFVSHQILDVSTVLGLMNRWLPDKQEDWRAHQDRYASYDHRALNDIEASIQSLRWARANLFVQPLPACET